MTDLFWLYSLYNGPNKRYHSSCGRGHFVLVLQKRDKIWYKVLALIFHQTGFLSGPMPLPHCDWFIVKCVYPAVYQWHDPLFTCSEFCSGCSYPHDFPCEFCTVFKLEGLEIVSTPLFFVRLTWSPTWFNMMNDIWPGECSPSWQAIERDGRNWVWKNAMVGGVPVSSPSCKHLLHFYMLNRPLSPNSDQHQFSPDNIRTLSRDTVMRINKMITKEKMPWSLNKFSQLIL